MKILKLLATVLLVALCTGFYSCGENDENNEEEYFKTAYLEYGMTDYKSIELPYTSYYEYVFSMNPAVDNDLINSQVKFSGLKNNHLWIASFDRNTKQKLTEWTDTKKFERAFIINLGYGEYKEVNISSIRLTQTYSYESNFVAIINIEHKGTIYIFNTPNDTKELTDKEIGAQYDFIQGWYKDSFFIGNTCYSFDGSVRYIANRCPSGIPVSYEETINAGATSIKRYNCKVEKDIWRTSITPPFEVPSDARKVITLLDNSTKTWKYRANYTFYDGTKKEYTFSINIDNGKIQ